MTMLHEAMNDDAAMASPPADVVAAISNRSPYSSQVRRRAEARAKPKQKNVRSDSMDEWQLRRASDMFVVGQMASGIAHDFNNRLQGVMGALDLVTARLKQGRAAECEILVEAAQDSLLRAGDLARQLLNFARPEQGVPSTIDVNDSIESMDVVLECLMGRRIEVSLDLGAGPMLAFCDGHQFESALLNLVVNARDAMPAGGRIRIETCHAELAVNAPGLRRGRYVRISVTDTGSGMTKEVARRAFDPFFTTKPSGKGTGLGLPMVKAFVDRSEGHVELQSAEGAGTTISIYLPSESA